VISSSSSSKYTQSYFAGFADESYEAAVTLLPDIYTLHPFHSVVDFGCGAGAWPFASRSRSICRPSEARR
jgi:cyclopropane fatty-acyl-phospholipid synthase-like methyltransferase